MKKMKLLTRKRTHTRFCIEDSDDEEKNDKEVDEGEWNDPFVDGVKIISKLFKKKNYCSFDVWYNIPETTVVDNDNDTYFGEDSEEDEYNDIESVLEKDAIIDNKYCIQKSATSELTTLDYIVGDYWNVDDYPQTRNLKRQNYTEVDINVNADEYMVDDVKEIINVDAKDDTKDVAESIIDVNAEDDTKVDAEGDIEVNAEDDTKDDAVEIIDINAEDDIEDVLEGGDDNPHPNGTTIWMF